MLTRRSLLTALATPLIVPRIPVTNDSTGSEIPDVSDKPFPNTAEANGYADILRAGKRLREAKAKPESDHYFTLAKKRVYLADPACQDALRIARQGIAKPIPLPKMESFETVLVEPLSIYRALARLFAADIAVLFADGKSEAGVRNVADILVLANSVKSQAVIGSLIGNATDVIILNAVAAEIDRWSLSDCEQLFQLSNRWLGAPQPIFAALSLEHELSRKMVEGERADPEKLIKTL